ncbi:MAG: glycosyltransferase family 2 protein [Bacteroidetes bacterium]|nr:glycosyltransferase family 2 protein [Rhodothermia bacterium]MCS7155890.1 glycosyltransferase family 2 protein [Bacteroidota bacterium]MCX7906009.1 glycosyltransferase family 2 protein [Bacteroidota bacterium]MDW8138137.1 glycosyltransferase family 2 protein [Bacteroidota bacterium]MDW8285821.1 glycosyltransferase family 2 protein [Bacteroidota bacterium]
MVEARSTPQTARPVALEKLRLSVVIPVYNENPTIEALIRRVLAVPLEKELIIVDDGSTDGTRYTLERLAQDPRIRVILQPENRGKGAAMRTGFGFVTGDVVIVQDADLEYDPAEYPKLVRPIAEGWADVVYGSRFYYGRPLGEPWWHYLGNRLLTWVSNRLTGLRLTDMETCYKVFRAEVLRQITIESDRFNVEPELTAKIAQGGWRVVEVPISYRPRFYAAGKKIGLKDAFEALWTIWRYRRHHRSR